MRCCEVAHGPAQHGRVSRAEQGFAADCQEPTLRFGPWQRLKPGVDMIDIANGCAKRTCKSDFWRNHCVNHSYFLICTQGKS